MKPTLYLLFGYPGAGKTTTAKMLARLTGATRLSSDELRLKMFSRPSFSQTEHAQLYQALNHQTEQLLADGKSVIYDANLNRRQHRQEKYEIARRQGAHCKLLWIKTPLQTARQRATDPARHPLIPPQETSGQMFDRIAEVLEEPLDDEQAIIVNGLNLDLDKLKDIVKL